MLRIIAMLIAMLTAGLLSGCEKTQEPVMSSMPSASVTEPSEPEMIEPTVPAAPATVSFQRIAKIGKMSEDFEFIYHNEEDFKVTFLLRGNPHRIFTFYPDGQVKSMEKYTADNVLYERCEYSQDGLVLSEAYPDGYPVGYQLNYEYNDQGQLVATVAKLDGYSAKTVERWTYDEQGRPVEHTDELDNWILLHFPEMDDPCYPASYNLKETWTYDSKGQVTQYTRYRNGALMLMENTEYDLQGNVTSTSLNYEEDGRIFCRNYYNEYDASNRLVEQRLIESKDENWDEFTKRITRYTYEGENLVCAVYSYEEGETYEERWTYDEKGTLRSAVTYDLDDPIQKTTEKFNEQGLITEKQIDQIGEPQHTYRYSYEYDDQGNLLCESYYEDDELAITDTYEYEGDKMVCHYFEDRYNPPGFLRLHYDEDGTLVDVSTDDLDSLMKNGGELMVAEGENRTLYFALHYETVEVEETAVAGYEKIQQFIIEQMIERG